MFSQNICLIILCLDHIVKNIFMYGQFKIL
jgi:hypothetical protein